MSQILKHFFISDFAVIRDSLKDILQAVNVTSEGGGGGMK
jgi:hypothetical protein